MPARPRIWCRRHCSKPIASLIVLSREQMSRPGCSLFCATRILIPIVKQYASTNRLILIVLSLSMLTRRTTQNGWTRSRSKTCCIIVQDDVKRALDALPEAYRLVVLLADMAELSYKDIAAIVGCPEGTVMSRLFRGRRLLRKSLQ